MFGNILIVMFGVINLQGSKAFEVLQSNGVETILAIENEDITLQCKADMPMAHCDFTHPNGTRYPFCSVTLDAGQCAIEIKASKGDSGEWRCYIRGKESKEVMQYINLRVVEQSATPITAMYGQSLTITCPTTKSLTPLPLRYCQFKPPNGKPFSVNSNADVSNPILDRYYFPKNQRLVRGDCAVTIRKVTYEDVGTWACSAGLDDGKEHIDTITLHVEGFYAMSVVSAVGITFGAIAIVAFLAILGFIVWKKRSFFESSPGDGAEEQELRHLSGQLMLRELEERTPEMSPRGSSHASPHGSRHVSPYRSCSTSPHESLHASPHGPHQASPHGPRHAFPQVSPRDSSHMTIIIIHIPITS